MKPRGQMIVVVAVGLLAAVILLAVMVDSGQVFVERARLERAAQAAADAGIGVVAEMMVTQVVPRLTQSAARSPCVPDGDYGDPGGTCTATPFPDQIEHWLTDEDRATLTAPSAYATAMAEVKSYASLNGVNPSAPDVRELQVVYPYDYDPQGVTLSLWVRIVGLQPVLMSSLLNAQELELPAEALSEIPQR